MHTHTRMHACTHTHLHFHLCEDFLTLTLCPTQTLGPNCNLTCPHFAGENYVLVLTVLDVQGHVHEQSRGKYRKENSCVTGNPSTYIFIYIYIYFKWDNLCLYFYFYLISLHTGASSSSTSSIFIPASKNSTHRSYNIYLKKKQQKTYPLLWWINWMFSLPSVYCECPFINQF